MDIQRTLIQLHMSANERAEPFVDHGGILRDAKTGRPIHGSPERENTTIFEDDLLRASFPLQYSLSFSNPLSASSWLFVLR